MPSASPKAHTRVLRFRRSLKLLRRPGHYYSPRLFIIRLEGIKVRRSPLPRILPRLLLRFLPRFLPRLLPRLLFRILLRSLLCSVSGSVFRLRLRFRFPASLAVPFSGSVRDRFSRDREGCSIHRRLSACRCRYKSSPSEHLSDRF